MKYLAHNLGSGKPTSKEERLEPKLSETMSVVHIMKHCGYANGSVHVAVDLACMQAKAGYDVTFVSSGGTFVPLLEQFGVRHVHMPHEQNQPFSVLRSAWRLSRLTRNLKPDILHAHMMSSALIGYVASKLCGLPLVTTVHNSFDKHSIIMRLGTRVVAVSNAEREQLLQKGYPKEKTLFVMNAPSNSPREVFMDDHRELTIKSPCIVAANALHGRKGVSNLIAACSTLFSEMP
jgi:UDP-N-acetylglucosamine:LPS N-acetylglucosamine transferase